jgi:2-polyprenyl-3-methyl-5-hydroxy-6-metoxy-1,4-benzoquinol methylase
MKDREAKVRPTADEVRSVWDANAEFWDRRMGDGNAWQRLLVAPSLERLLELERDERVLDLACGSGHVARWLAGLGAKVVAADFSTKFLERARERIRGLENRIELVELDATSADALKSESARGRFHAVVCNMALMDMAEIEPLAKTLDALLEPSGRFVISILHPSFHSPGVRLGLEEEVRDGVVTLERYVKVGRYATPAVFRGMGLEGQPASQFYFHRPLGKLLAPFFREGFVLDALDEPTFPLQIPADRTVSWVDLLDVPPILSARLRRATAIR